MSMKFNESLLKTLSDAINGALKKFRQSDDLSVVTDIYLQPLHDSAELRIYDDDEELAVVSIPQLNDIPEDVFYVEMEKLLRKSLQQIDKLESLETLSIWKPFSFVMVDDDKETYYELMLIDDDTALVSQTLMEGLDKELDDFLSDLLEF